MKNSEDHIQWTHIFKSEEMITENGFFIQQKETVLIQYSAILKMKDGWKNWIHFHVFGFIFYKSMVWKIRKISFTMNKNWNIKI